MVKTHVGHLVFGVQAANMPFYKELLTFLGWNAIYDGAEMLGVGDGQGVSLWFGTDVKPVSNDYDGPGVNHIAFAVSAQADVDAAAAYLAAQNVELLFETPRHRPEFAHGADQTYYQIMFETPDRLLLEVVYTGPKS